MIALCCVFQATVVLLSFEVTCQYSRESSPKVEQQDDYNMTEKPNYIQYNGSAKVIRDDLIPMKNMFSYSDRRKLGDTSGLDDEVSDEGPIKNGETELDSRQFLPPKAAGIDYIGRWKSSSGRWSSLQDDKFDLKEQWTKGGPVKILIHGFTPNSWITPEERIKNQMMYDIGNAYYAKSTTNNIIVMDWTSLSTQSHVNYHKAADASSTAAHDLANRLVYLKNIGLITNWNDVHLIGFSLGAHVAGGAGRLIRDDTGYSIGHITGIDPAGPRFHSNGLLPSNRDYVLDYGDAKFVDVIHCNMGYETVAVDGGHFGTPAQSGHADFYPNGGEKQKGCSKYDLGCSHKKCLYIYLQAISHNYLALACPCGSWDNFARGYCTCTTSSGGVYMGERLDSSNRVQYYLDWA